MRAGVLGDGAASRSPRSAAASSFPPVRERPRASQAAVGFSPLRKPVMVVCECERCRFSPTPRDGIAIVRVEVSGNRFGISPGRCSRERGGGGREALTGRGATALWGHRPQIRVTEVARESSVTQQRASSNASSRSGRRIRTSAPMTPSEDVETARAVIGASRLGLRGLLGFTRWPAARPRGRSARRRGGLAGNRAPGSRRRR